MGITIIAIVPMKPTINIAGRNDYTSDWNYSTASSLN